MKDFKQLTKNNKVKPIKKPQQKKKEIKEKSTFNDLKLSLDSTISENYKGTSDNIIGVIHSLPKAIKGMFTDASVKSILNRQGYAMIVLSNGFTFKLKDVKVQRKPKTELCIKQGKKIIFNAII